MSNRRYYQYRYSLEPQVVDTFAYVTFGSTGAPTLSASQSRGVTSITRTAAGKYDVVFTDRFNRFLGVDYSQINTTAVAAPDMRVTADSINSATPKISIAFSTGGTDTDPASGEAVRLHFTFKNSSV